jgi:transcriptional regulator with XRE-family HTH domain
MNIGDKIKNRIREKGISINELEKGIGIAQNSIHGMIKRNDYKVSVLEKIAEYLGVRVGYFFPNENGEGDESKRMIMELQPGDVVRFDIDQRRIEIIKK